MKLISMTAYIEEIHADYMKTETAALDSHMKIVRYKDFLKTPLELGMFVPCDEIGEVMNEQEIKGQVMDGTNSWDEYQQAKERVIFAGRFDVDKDLAEQILIPECKTIEGLLVKNYLTLTPAKAKELGL